MVNDSGAYLGILVELVGGDVVNGEDELDIVLLGLLDQRGYLLRASSIEEGVADLRGTKPFSDKATRVEEQ